MAGIIGNMTAQAELTNEFFGTMQGNVDSGMGIYQNLHHVVVFPCFRGKGIGHLHF